MASEHVVLSVPGVSCEHCRTAIADEVSAVGGVTAVAVDLDRKLVTAEGSGLDERAVRAAIETAGYDVGSAGQDVDAAGGSE